MKKPIPKPTPVPAGPMRPKPRPVTPEKGSSAPTTSKRPKPNPKAPSKKKPPFSTVILSEGRIGVKVGKSKVAPMTSKRPKPRPEETFIMDELEKAAGKIAKKILSPFSSDSGDTGKYKRDKPSKPKRGTGWNA